MSNELALVEKSFAPYLPAFQEVLRPMGMAAERIIRTVIIACEKTPKLLECRRQTLINAAMTGAVLGLEMDGWSGQGFVIPYKDIAQFQIGYKGYPTIGERSGTTVKGDAVREADEFDYSDGSQPFVHFKKKPASREARGKIIGAWAAYTAKDRPAFVVFMPIDDILAIKAKSPGARKPESPWNDVGGPGFEAMCAKTAVRNGGRFCPIIGIQRAVALEDHQDMGQAVFLRPDGAVTIDGKLGEDAYPPRQPGSEGAPVALESPIAWVLGDGTRKTFPDVEQWERFVMRGVDGLDAATVAAARERNAQLLVGFPDRDAALRVSEAMNKKAGAAPAAGVQ